MSNCSQTLGSARWYYPMRARVTYWTALFLLLMSFASFSSLVGSMVCAASAQPATPDAVAVTSFQASTSSDPAACPLATLAEFVATPMVITPVALFGVVRPAYEAPPYLSPHYRVDPEPPTKPPSA